MLSLVQLGDTESYAAIKALFKSTSNPRTITNGAAALALLGDDESLGLLLDKTLLPGIPAKILSELVYNIASIKGRGDDIYKFLKLHSKDKPSALMQLAELCSDPQAAARMAAALDSGSSNEPIRMELVAAFTKIGTAKDYAIARFLNSKAAEAAPPELLLSLLPLAEG